MPSVIRRTLRDIRTNSGKIDRFATPHRAYMQITALEMEKARKESERQACLARLDAIGRRMRAIESEKSYLVRGLARTGSLVVPLPSEPAEGPSQADKPASAPARPSRIRYRT